MLEKHQAFKQAAKGFGDLEACTLCHGRGVQKVREFSKELIINRWKEFYAISIESYFDFDGDSLSLWKCQQCGVQTFSPHPLAAPAELYIAMAKRNPAAYFTPEKWEFKQALTDLKGCSNILEIGYGSGEFLRAAVKAGLTVQGVELSPESSANAATKGLPILLQSLEQLASQQEKIFDGICSFQVLEHVSSPSGFIERCYRLLKPGGRLILAVPNDESYVLRPTNLLNMPPHHLTRWTSECFRWIANKYGFELLRSCQEPLPKELSHSFLETLCENSPWTLRVLPASLRYQIGKAVKTMGLHKILKGEGLYVVLQKNR